ncbi:dihydroorotase [Halopenitus persicus]|uniref:dihydroorotase n=1 Tax=Halopenitus persicus TaxID=1048396 RepID=UPI000BBB4F5E|nr:amidohydrolase family protein [Halopenitus persicus]
MPVQTRIDNGEIVTSSNVREGSVAIDDGKIVAIGTKENVPQAERVINAEGKIILPGIVDPHVHIDEVPESQGRAGKMETETAAAALGGVTTLIDFAYQGGDLRLNDGKDLIAGIKHKRSKNESSYVDYSLHGVLHRETARTLDEIELAIEEGVTSFKMFMSSSEMGVSNGFIFRAFEKIAEENAVAAVHTEDISICEAREGQLKRAGKGDSRFFADSRPDFAEAMAAEDAIRAAVETGVKYYGVHTTCRKAAEVFDWFQEDNSNIRAETCTHYTVLDRSSHEKFGNRSVLKPPLRTPDDREAMFEYLQNGTLTVVSTDHVTYYEDYKQTSNWWDSPYGVNSIQYSLPVFYEIAIRQRNLSWPFLVQVMCRNPAQTFGIPQKGTLDPGTDADIVIFDPDSGSDITAENNASNSTFSIYEGMHTSGSVEKVFVRGNLIADAGEIVAEKGHGEFIQREIPQWTN